MKMDRTGQILAIVTDIQGRIIQMADVMDQVLADVQQAVTDLQTEGQEIAQIIATLQQVQSGAIATSDPRFQQAMDALTSLDNTIKTQTQSIQSALPTPPPTP